MDAKVQSQVLILAQEAHSWPSHLPCPHCIFSRGWYSTKRLCLESSISTFSHLMHLKKILCISSNHIQLELSFCKVRVGQLGNPRPKSSTYLQLSLQILAVGSKNYTLLRDLWEVSVPFDIPIHPHLSPSPHGLHSPFPNLCVYPSHCWPVSVFSAMEYQEWYLET